MGVARLDRITNAEQLKSDGAARKGLRLMGDHRVVIHRPKVHRLRLEVEIQVGKRLGACLLYTSRCV